MKLRPLAIFLGVLPSALFAHDPITTKITWTQEISRIISSRCVSCHADGSSVALATYSQARPWAKAIRDQVLSRRMPPWGAVAGAGAFRNDPSLTGPEMERVVQWVEGGAPEGDPLYLPSMRAAQPPAVPRFRAALRIAAGRPVTLPADQTFAGIRPDSALEAIALRPDGRVEHLIWLREYYGLSYQFLDPVRLPKGTVVRVTHGSAALLRPL